MVAAVATAWLLLWVAACAQSEQDFYDFKAVNIRGKLVSLEKYRGSVSDGPLRAWCWGWGGGGACRGPPNRGSVRMLPSGVPRLGHHPRASQPRDRSVHPALPRPLPTQPCGYVAQLRSLRRELCSARLRISPGR